MPFETREPDRGGAGWRMRRRTSFQAWLLGFATASALPLLVFAGWLVVENHLAARRAALHQVQQTARALAQAMDRQLRTYEGIAVTQASSDSLRRNALPEFYSEAQRVLGLESGIIALVLHDPTGQQIVNTLRPMGEKLPKRGDIENFAIVLSGRAPRVSNLFRGALVGGPVVGIDAPVLIEGQVRYILTVIISLDALGKLLRDQKLPPGWLAGLFDRNGILVARSRAAKQYVGRPGVPLLLAGIRAAPEGSVETPTLEGDVVISTWSRLQDSGWAAAIAIPKDDFTAPLWNDLFIVIVAGLLVLALGGVAAMASAAVLARRVAVLASAAAGLGEGKAFEPPPPGVRELDELATALEKAGEILRGREQQRDAAELRRRVLSAELDHRVKNILAVAQALARQTLGRSDVVEAYMGRLQALSSSHAALAEAAWSGVGIRRLIEVAMAPFRHAADHRITIDGPDADLKPRAAQSLALILHELATNAAKYGALSAEGRVDIRWQRPPDRDQITITWNESGGPEISKPPKGGFGTNLIERLSRYDLGGTAAFDYRPDGLRCRIELALSDVAFAPTPVPATISTEQPEQKLPGRKRILIVEDVALTALAIERTVLEAGGVPVGPFHSVRDAIAALERERVDAALLDVNVNGELVFPLADRLKHAGIPLIFVTGYSETHLWPSAWKHTPRLVKPVSLRDLSEAWAKHF